MEDVAKNLYLSKVQSVPGFEAFALNKTPQST